MERIQRIETLIREIESSADPAARASIRELVEAILEYHGAGVERTLEIIRESGPSGDATIRAIGRDPLTGSLLLLYGLHPEDFETRVRRAADALPGVQLISAAEGVVRLRAISAAASSRDAIERALYSAAPEISSLEIEGMQEAAAAFVPVEALLRT